MSDDAAETVAEHEIASGEIAAGGGLGGGAAGATPNSLLGHIRRISRRVRPLLLAIVVVFAFIALRDNWGAVHREARAITPLDLVLSGLAFVGAIACQYLAWLRALLALHAPRMPHRKASTIFCTAGLGKYVPGAVWPVVIQTEMGSDAGVPWRLMVASYGLILPLSIATGAIVSALTLTGPAVAWIRPLVIAGAILGLLGVWLVTHPRAFHSLMDKVLRRLTGEGLPGNLDTRYAVQASLITFVSWGFAGLSAWILCRPLGAGASDIPFVVGAFVLSWVCGLVAVPLPAGLGVRDAILVLTLGELIGHPQATTVALLGRLTQVIVDLLLAALTGVPAAMRRVRGRHSHNTARS
ncbi:MAG TPA: YbhN family protein [Acidimicrobiia bacterium]